MNRQELLDRLRGREPWDVLIAGGGATGLGIAIDAAARGYRTLLVEQGDFARATSSRSTKLAHGGVRYLKQGNVALVLEALEERGLMRQNAPHLVHDLPFVVPNYDWWEAPFYGAGLRVYDLLAGKHGFGRSRNLSREETLERLPTIETRGLRGGVVYYDGQFDDARLAVDMALTALELGGTVLNYVEVTGLVREDDFVRGARLRDVEAARDYEVRARVVINATGAFCDDLRRMDDPEATPVIAPSQGVHIVLDRSFLPGESAIMVPKTDDGRVLFAIPWQERVVVGTTDTEIPEPVLEPRPQPEEIDFLLEHAALYLEKDPTPADVLSVFAGVRPLVRGDGEPTAALARDHSVMISRSGLVTVAGGKWTTYRKMAEDALDRAAALGQLDERPCPTRTLRIHGYHTDPARFGSLAAYGADAPEVQDLLKRHPPYAEPLHPRLPARAGEVVWAAEQEMARTVEDFLARRTRSLILDARAAAEAAPRVAALLGASLGRGEAWQSGQVEAFRELAAGYVLS